MVSPSTLKSRTDTLCAELEQFAKLVQAKMINPDDAKRQWELTYRPEASYLAEEMLQYVSNDDPRIIVTASAGNRRTIKADAVNCIGARFSDQYVLGFMHTIRQQLSGLARTLPAQTSA
jgi:hypothetical protein